MPFPQAGLLFDLDGTLVHTDPIHLRAFNRMLAPYGLSVTEESYAQAVMGRQNAAIMADFFPGKTIAQHEKLAEQKEAYFRDMAASLSPQPGLMTLLAAAKAQDLPWGIVTNAPRANAALMLGALGLSEAVGTLVLGDELPRAKPDPLPYQEGARRLGLDIARTVAFEDSRSGIAAARDAGLPVVGMMTTLSKSELLAAGATLAAADFADDDLLALVSERTGLVL